MDFTTFVGLDVHKDSIAVAVARRDRQEPEQLGVIPNTPEPISRMMRKLGKAETLEVCYEAGPCRDGLVGAALKKLQQGVPEEVKSIAWKAQNRLNKKYKRMVGRGKLRVVAMARELMGFIWAIAQEVARRNLENP